ncbi:MAG: hypothetical protein ACLUEQ_09370 [Cloacibacillus evryensis]
MLIFVVAATYYRAAASSRQRSGVTIAMATIPEEFPSLTSFGAGPEARKTQSLIRRILRGDVGAVTVLA